MADSTSYVRQAVVGELEAAPTLLALVPADRVFGPQRPAGVPWPFVAYGQPITAPFGASCLEGSRISVAIHAYAETSGTGDATVGGSDMAEAIVRVIVSVLDGATLDLQALTDCPYPATAHISWTGSNVVQDGAEADAFHGWATFDIQVAS